jgi:hypothetical protein
MKQMIHFGDIPQSININEEVIESGDERRASLTD